MKTIVILGDGMADRPCPELGGKTPLQAARCDDKEKNEIPPSEQQEKRNRFGSP